MNKSILIILVILFGLTLGQVPGAGSVFMRSLLYIAAESFELNAKLISELSNHAFFIGGIILAAMILQRRLAVRGACLKFPHMHWSDIEEPKEGEAGRAGDWGKR